MDIIEAHLLCCAYIEKCVLSLVKWYSLVYWLIEHWQCYTCVHYRCRNQCHSSVKPTLVMLRWCQFHSCTGRVLNYSVTFYDLEQNTPANNVLTIIGQNWNQIHTLWLFFYRQKEELHFQEQKLKESWTELETKRKRLVAMHIIQIVISCTWLCVLCDRQEEELHSQQRELEQSRVELEAEKSR